MENVVFDVAEVNLPFHAIIGRPALYWFMAIAHYGYLVLKMPSPTGVLTMRGDRAAALAAVEKLHALVVETARPDDGGGNPSTSGTKALPKVPKVQPSRADDVPVKATGLLRIPPKPLALQVIWAKIGTRARRLPPGKCRCVRMGAVADAWDPQGGDRAPSEDQPRC
jgi:hypothetical protein